MSDAVPTTWGTLLDGGRRHGHYLTSWPWPLPVVPLERDERGLDATAATNAVLQGCEHVHISRESTRVEWRAFATAARDSKMRSLHVSVSGMTRKEWFWFCESVATSKLEELSIQGGSRVAFDWDDLTRALLRCGRVERLIVASERISAASAATLAWATASLKLTQLSLRSCDVGNAAFVIVARAAATHGVRALRFSGCNLHSDAVKVVADELCSSSCIEELMIVEHRAMIASAAATEAVARLVRTTTSLRKLDVDNVLTPSGARDVGRAVVASRTVEHVEFGPRLRRVRNHSMRARHAVVATLALNGKPIPANARGRVTQEFFRADGDRAVWSRVVEFLVW